MDYRHYYPEHAGGSGISAGSQTIDLFREQARVKNVGLQFLGRTLCLEYSVGRLYFLNTNLEFDWSGTD